MVIKILIPTIIILVIFFTLRYNNIYQEHFKTLGKLEINFTTKDSIFMISDKIQNITQKIEGTVFKKTQDIIYSNDTLFSEDGRFSGFLFSIEPGKRLKIGFSNLEKDLEISLVLLNSSFILIIYFEFILSFLIKFIVSPNFLDK